MKEKRYELDPIESAPGEARQALERDFGELVGGDTLASLQLVVSELVTNSVKHGPGRPIRLEVELDRAGALRGEVEDQGDGVVEIREEAKELDTGGRGLRIVDALTERWGVFEGSTHVWFEIPPPRGT